VSAAGLGDVLPLLDPVEFREALFLEPTFRFGPDDGTVATAGQGFEVPEAGRPAEFDELLDAHPLEPGVVQVQFRFAHRVTIVCISYRSIDSPGQSAIAAATAVASASGIAMVAAGTLVLHRS